MIRKGERDNVPVRVITKENLKKKRIREKGEKKEKDEKEMKKK